MRDISLHLLDIIQNSISANATAIEISMVIDSEKDTLCVTIADNGKGMSEELLKRVESPFTTTRTTRKVGLGIPLFKEGALSSGGTFRIESTLGIGTTVQAVYGFSHIDRPPLGDVAGTLQVIIIGNPDIDFIFRAEYGGAIYQMDTKEVKETLEDVPITDLDVQQWLQNDLIEGIQDTFGGVI